MTGTILSDSVDPQLMRLVQRVGNEFDRVRWDASREIEIHLLHDGERDLELGAKLPWTHSTRMESVSNREPYVLEDVADNPELDQHQPPGVRRMKFETGGDAYVMTPAHRMVFMHGEQRDVERIAMVAERAGKLMRKIKPNMDTDTKGWRFTTDSAVFWHFLFEFAFTRHHPLLQSEKKLWVAKSNTYYPYDAGVIRRMRELEVGGFADALPEQWSTKLPDRWLADLKFGICACCDAWESFYPPVDQHQPATIPTSVDSPAPATITLDSPAPANPITIRRRFRIGLSFPGSHREKVRNVVDCLTPIISTDRLLYDHFHQVELARTDLDIYLPELYKKDSDLVVVFMCKEYLGRDWCGLEWDSIRSIIKDVRKDALRVMLLKLDDVQDIPGFPDVHGYIEVQDVQPREIANMILRRLEIMN